MLKVENLFLRHTGLIALAESGSETAEDELTGFDNIITWS